MSSPPSPSPSLPPRIEALLLLDAYNKRQTMAHSEQKACFWNIQKARRVLSMQSVTVANAVTAENIREGIYPRAVLLNAATEEPNLVKEGSSGTDTDTGTGSGSVNHNNSKNTPFELTWTLVDPVAQKEKQKNAAAVSSDKENQQLQQKGDKGLRNRKGQKDSDAKNRDADTNDKCWTTELLEEEDDNSSLLRKANPVDLFGALPPRDLRVAQDNAKAALAAYIDAANLAVAILKLTAIADDKK